MGGSIQASARETLPAPADDALDVLGVSCERMFHPAGHRVWVGRGPCSFDVKALTVHDGWVVSVHLGTTKLAEGRGETLFDASMACRLTLAFVLDGGRQLLGLAERAS